jgi:rubrerythrin
MTQFDNVEDVLDFAIAKEIEAHRFYVELAQWAERPEVARVFEDFSVDELRHKLRLEAIKAGRIAFEKDEIGNLGIADRLEAIEPKANLGYSEALVVGMQREKEAFRFYTGLASVAHRPDVKDVLLKLAQEEAGHKLRLEIEYDLTTF